MVLGLDTPPTRPPLVDQGVRTLVRRRTLSELEEARDQLRFLAERDPQRDVGAGVTAEQAFNTVDKAVQFKMAEQGRPQARPSTQVAGGGGVPSLGLVRGAQAATPERRQPLPPGPAGSSVTLPLPQQPEGAPAAIAARQPPEAIPEVIPGLRRTAARDVQTGVPSLGLAGPRRAGVPGEMGSRTGDPALDLVLARSGSLPQAAPTLRRLAAGGGEPTAATATAPAPQRLASRTGEPTTALPRRSETTGAPVGAARRLGLVGMPTRARPTTAASGDVRARIDEAAAGTRRPQQAGRRSPQALEGFSFEENPLGAIAIALGNFAAGVRGEELPSTRIRRRQESQRTEETRRAALAVRVFDTFSTAMEQASPAQRRQVAAAFEERFGGITGIPFSDLASDEPMDLRRVATFARGIDPEIVASLGTTTRDITSALLDSQTRELAERMSDNRNLTPALEKVAGNVDTALGLTAADQQGRLREQTITMLDIERNAEAFDLTGPELAALRRNQADAFPQLSERTGLNFATGERLAERGDRPASGLRAFRNSGDRAITLSSGRTVQPGGVVTLDVTDPAQRRDVTRFNLREEPSRVERGEAGAFEPTAPEVRTLNNAEISTRNFIDTSERLIGVIEDNPQALAAVGRVSQAANALAATAEGIAKLATEGGEGEAAFTVGGREASAEDVKRAAIERVGGEFFEALAGRLGQNIGQAAIDAARVQSMVVDLAFAAAAASGQTGRAVSDRDVERFLRQIGESADPAVFTSVLRDMQQRSIDKFENTARTLNSRLPQAQRIDVPDLRRELQPAPQRGRGGQAVPPPDAPVAENPETGERVFWNGNEWVPF